MFLKCQWHSQMVATNSGEIHGAKFKFKTAGEREKQTDKRLYSKQHDLI